MDPTVGLVLVVLVFAAVQSVFGVGLLVFGTPFLLLLGFPFPQVLAHLLPASMVISVLQVVEGGRDPAPIRRLLLLYTGPAVLITSALVVGSRADVNIRPLVGVMLVVTAAIRVMPSLRRTLSNFARARLRWLLLLLGLVHGASNLGGGILTVLVGSVYDDKQAMRRHIAFGYLLMAALQLSTVVLSGWPAVDGPTWVLLPVLAATVHTVLGRRIFRATGQAAYQWVITALVASFGLLLLLSPL